jgi:hypothetical protein
VDELFTSFNMSELHEAVIHSRRGDLDALQGASFAQSIDEIGDTKRFCAVDSVSYFR